MIQTCKRPGYEPGRLRTKAEATAMVQMAVVAAGQPFMPVLFAPVHKRSLPCASCRGPLRNPPPSPSRLCSVLACGVYACLVRRIDGLHDLGSGMSAKVAHWADSRASLHTVCRVLGGDGCLESEGFQSLTFRIRVERSVMYPREAV